MRKILGVGACLILATATIFYVVSNKEKTHREEYEHYLASHPFKKMLIQPEASGDDEEKGDRPDRGMMQNYLRTMDPALKRPTPELLFDLNQQTARARDAKNSAAKTEALSLASGTVWTERGPKMVGGRTRALLFDPNDATKKKVWAGGVTGGLWVNNDITSASSPWTKVNDLWDNLGISCIASDPTNPQIFYVGTGEFEYAVRGAGIWKTTNGGATWTRLVNTQNFIEIRDLVVRNESGVGVVYAAIHPGFGPDNPVYAGGLYRSGDGGTTWAQVLPFASGSTNEYTNLPTDIEIGSDNTLWVGAKKHFWVDDARSTLYRSFTGLPGSWGSVSTFPGNAQFDGQIELAVAPSNANVVYIVTENDQKIGGMYKTTDKGATLSSMALPVDADLGIPPNDFSRNQAWYDLILAVHPTESNNVIVGAINTFKSTNSGASWVQLTKWSNNANMNNLTIPLVHADHHEIIYRPGFPNEAVFGTDGGVYYATGLGTTAPTIEMRNLNYNVTQFYSGAIHPTQTNFMLGGTQDNGTIRFTQPGFAETTFASGGDGAFCFIDEKDPAIQIVSYVYNDWSLSLDGGNSFPIQLIDDPSSGNFINNGDYDPNVKAFYASKDANSIYRVKNVNLNSRTVDQISVSLGSISTAMQLSPFTTAQSNLYVGTEAGRLLKIVNANGSPSITDITGVGFPTGSISSIAFGANESQILVTFFNYGVVNIWETRNGGGSWVNREGDLPNMPVRWATYHPVNPNQVYIATELGVWSTDDINVTSPVWTSTNGGLANVRTDMLQIRKTDNVIMAATFGRGIFTAPVPTELDQEITFNALPAKTFGDPTFQLTATASSGLPVTFLSSNTAVATVTGTTVTIVGAGITNIIAQQNGNVQYKPAADVMRILTVNKATQTISFVALEEVGVNDNPFNLSATSTSSLPVSFLSSNAAVATIAGTTITIKGPGSTTITATQAGNENFLAAPNVTRTLNVVTRVIELVGDLDFGDVIFGEEETRTFTIQNSGTGGLQVTGFTYPSGYSGVPTVSASNILVTVTLKPTALTDYNGEIIVASNATSGNNKIAAKGRGVKITGDDSFTSEAYTVSPNPADGFIQIDVPTSLQVDVLQVTDVSGKSFWEPIETISKTSYRMKVSHLGAGNYFLTIPDRNKSVVIRFNKN